MDTDRILDTARAWIEGHANAIAALSDRIWDHAEPGYCEARSAQALCDLMAEHGFSIEMGVAHMPTAFVATFGSGRPRIGVMCEYDATPGEAQAAKPYPEADPDRNSGFTDLHNGIGVASAAAAAAIAEAMKAHGVDGSVVAFGTPAEKLCAGKPLMAQNGCFDGLDAVVAWHPRPYSTVEWDLGPGIQQGEIYDFTGKSAYSARPWTGVNALDAAVLMNVITQFLRDHLPKDDRATLSEMISRGGQHPTSIPGHAQSWFVLRAATRPGVERLSAALERAAEAACVAIGTSYRRRIISATRPWLPNHAIAELCYRNLQRAGAPRFSTVAKHFAAEALENLGARPDAEPFDETLTDPRAGVTRDFAGGTDDVNEFCWHAPTARIYVAHGLRTTHLPNWARAAFCRGETAHPTVLSAARAVAFSVLELMADRKALDTAKEEFRRRTAEGGHIAPLIPPDTRPPLDSASTPAYVREHQLRNLQHAASASS